MINNEEQNDSAGTSVFISGLPYQSSEADVEKFFKDCGKIEQIKLPKFQDTGRLLGYGHVTFKSATSVEKALALSGAKIGERYIDVKMAKGENENKSFQRKVNDDRETKTIFVKGLPYDVTEDEVGDAFRHCGPIENVRFVYNTVQKHFKGFGYIDFKEEKSTKKALEMSGKNIKGRKIFVDLDYSTPKAGYRYKMESDNNQKYAADLGQIMRKKIKKEEHKQKELKPLNKKAAPVIKNSESRPDKKSELLD